MIYTKNIKYLLLIIILLLSTKDSFLQITDKDGNTYKTVVIDNKEWMLENLNVEHYRNGDLIPQVQNSDEWSNLKTGAWCYYKNKTQYGVIYGKLYNWYAVNDPRGLAPKGWHIPSDDEWTDLIDFCGGESFAGSKLKDINLWKHSNANVTNETNFSALPGSYRRYDGFFPDEGEECSFWASTVYEKDTCDAWSRSIRYNTNIVHRHEWSSTYGFSVRCVKGNDQERPNEFKKESSEKSRIDILSEAINSGRGLTPGNYLERGNEYSKIGDFNKAIQDFTKAIELDTCYGDAYNARGCDYAMIKEYSKALLDFNNAIFLYNNVTGCRLFIGIANVYFNRGLCYYNYGKMRNACDDWGIAFNIYGDTRSKELLDKFCKK